MKIYKTQAEVDADIVDGELKIEGDVFFEFNLSTSAYILIKDGNISAMDISARNISARNISALNISAWDISALNISAGDISFNAVAYAYSSFKCKSIIGRRKNSKYFCLDKDVEITGEEQREDTLNFINHWKSQTDEGSQEVDRLYRALKTYQSVLEQDKKI